MFNFRHLKEKKHNFSQQYMQQVQKVKEFVNKNFEKSINRKVAENDLRLNRFAKRGNPIAVIGQIQTQMG